MTANGPSVQNTLVNIAFGLPASIFGDVSNSSIIFCVSKTFGATNGTSSFVTRPSGPTLKKAPLTGVRFEPPWPPTSIFAWAICFASNLLKNSGSVSTTDRTPN